MSGTMTFYESDDPTCSPIVRTAGQGYLDAGEHAHIARNESGATAINVVTYFAPVGAALRIDQPRPGNCTSSGHRDPSSRRNNALTTRGDSAILRDSSAHYNPARRAECSPRSGMASLAALEMTQEAHSIAAGVGLVTNYCGCHLGLEADRRNRARAAAWTLLIDDRGHHPRSRNSSDPLVLSGYP